MLSDKELKARYEKKFKVEFDKYYPIEFINDLGFTRNKCSSCGRFFWNLDPNRKVCGDASCQGRYSFIGKSPARNKLGYIETWKVFSRIMKKQGYTPIKRLPITARWRSDIPFVEASIDDFIPYVVNGEVEPPANPLVIPQVCLRFNDIDNVGLTGAHYCSFVMIGQHLFTTPQEYEPNLYLEHLFKWFKEGVGLDKKYITLHEDIWAGSGNFGPCIEIFSSGLELANQVYMQFTQTKTGYKDLNLKVLDMGMGHERIPWFTSGNSTSYETTFPKVISRLLHSTGFKINKSLQERFLPYSALLNVDEAKSIEKVWQQIAKELKVDVRELKEEILTMAAIYSIAEHSRALLISISDRALPSNTGGGYNLRVLFRRAQSLIDRYGWDINIPDIYTLHAKELKGLFPELSENLGDVGKILEVELDKYRNTKNKSRGIVMKVIKDRINNQELVRLYDTYGITPELIRDEARNFGKEVKIPDNFYALVAGLHKKAKQQSTEEKETEIDLKGIPDTEVLYYQDHKKSHFKAKVVGVKGNKIILDKTYFYPTSGGQLHDTGTIANEEVIDVFKQGKVVLHVLKGRHEFPVGEEVTCEINKERRLQLTQNHDAAHILLAASRKVLGNHINQAGAFKDVDKAHLDITHYKGLDLDEIKNIEREANSIISDKLPIYKRFMLRNDAEKSYGFNIYQGPAVPGKMLRIVSIASIDTEACGGTHSDNTFEVGLIRVLKASKISDSVVRIEYIAGNKASEEIDREKAILSEVAKILKVNKKQVPSRVKELFELWKDVVKKKKKLEIKLISDEELDLDDKELLQKAASILKTQPEHITKTVKRFLRDLGKV